MTLRGSKLRNRSENTPQVSEDVQLRYESRLSQHLASLVAYQSPCPYCLLFARDRCALGLMCVPAVWMRRMTLFGICSSRTTLFPGIDTTNVEMFE